jgi:hypothetical protein
MDLFYKAKENISLYKNKILNYRCNDVDKWDNVLLVDYPSFDVYYYNIDTILYAQTHNSVVLPKYLLYFVLSGWTKYETFPKYMLLFNFRYDYTSVMTSEYLVYNRYQNIL